MARIDQAQRVGRAGEGVEQAIGLHARQAEHGVDAVAHQAVDDGFSAGHTRHGLVLLMSGREGGMARREGEGCGV